MAKPANQSRILFRERVLPSILGWSPLLLLGVGVGVAISPVAPVWLASSLGALAVIVASYLVWILAPIIELSDTQIRVSNAHLPIACIGEVSHFSGQEAFQQRGPGLDARAFVKFQATVTKICRIQVEDPADPTPYWIFSSRRPEELAQLIRTLKSGSAQNL